MVKEVLVAYVSISSFCFGGSVDVDVDNEYIAISALRLLTAPVPWDATCV
jgi:hypothetical protein